MRAPALRPRPLRRDRHPRSPSPSGLLVMRGGLGAPSHPAHPMSARQMAYCSPMRKPLVPSIGLSIQTPVRASSQSRRVVNMVIMMLVVHLRPLDPPA